MGEGTLTGRKGALSLFITEVLILAPYIAGFALQNWVVVKQEGIFDLVRATMGLWQACGFDHDMVLIDRIAAGDECFSLLETGVPGWVRAAEGFAILGLFFGISCLILTLVMAFGPCDEDMIFKIFLPSWLLGGFCMIVTIIIFGSNMPPSEMEKPIMRFGVPISSVTITQEFSTGFIIEAICACLWNVFGIIFLCAICCC